MSEEETLNHLFEKARKAPSETNVSDIQKWIGLATLGTILIGLLSKLNVVFTKTIIMYSAATFLTAGIGLATFIAFNNDGNEKEIIKSGAIVKTEEPVQTPAAAESAGERVIALVPPTKNPVQEIEPIMEEQPEESPVEALHPIPFTPLSSESPSENPIAFSKKSEEKDYGSFSKIKLRDAVDVYILQGKKESVRIEGEPDPKCILEIKNNGGTLTIGNAKTRGNVVNNRKKQKVYVTVVDISKIDCSGAIHLKSQGDLNLKKMELSLSGATNVVLDVQLDELILGLSGATDVKLNGKAKLMNLYCSGASKFDASSFQVTDAKIESSGANDTKIYVTGNLEINASGASAIKCKGDPTISKKTLTGAASYKPLQ